MDQTADRGAWLIDPSLTFLNHGSYGACPRPVLEAQSEWRARMERQPLAFLGRDVERHLDEAREQLATFLGAQPAGVVFQANATTGINTVLRSLPIDRGDELLATDHEYNACLNALRQVAHDRGARVVLAHVPFPIAEPGQLTEAVLAAVTSRTRICLVSHVTSGSALVFPLEELVARLAERGVDTLVDGAHAPGMLPLELDRLGAAYYAGNGHKWLCGPKGSGFLHVRRDRQAGIRPLVISHGTNSPRQDRSRFRLEFDWLGTTDPTPYLSLPVALNFMAGLLPGGWPALMQANRQLALDGRQRLLHALDKAAPAPAEMIGAMAAIPLSEDLEPAPPPADPRAAAGSQYPLDPLHDLLQERHRIEVPVYPWPPAPADRPCLRLLRISAQAYNRPADYQRLADVLGGIAGSSVTAYPSPP